LLVSVDGLAQPGFGQAEVDGWFLLVVSHAKPAC
jgi:hypothetical protein